MAARDNHPRPGKQKLESAVQSNGAAMRRAIHGPGVSALLLSAIVTLSLPSEAKPLSKARARRINAPQSTAFAGPPELRVAKAKQLLVNNQRPVDVELGLKLLQFDALQGHSEAQYELGCFVASRATQLRKQLAGLRWLVWAESSGHPLALESWKRYVNRLNPLAQRMAHSQAERIRKSSPLWRAKPHDTPRLHSAAEMVAPPLSGLQTTQAQAESGATWAQTTLGHVLQRTPETQEAGLTWWFRAALQGDRLAMRNLSESLVSPQISPSQPILAFAYWCLAYDEPPASAIGTYPDAHLLPPDAIPQTSAMIARWRHYQKERIITTEARETNR